MYSQLVKPNTHLLAIDSRLDVPIIRDGLQQQFHHAEHFFNRDPLISQPIFILFSINLRILIS